MKKRASALSFGPGASSLILIFVVLSMTVLGMLALLSAQNDLHLSQRSAQVIEAQYRLSSQAEKRRADIDEILTQCRQGADTQDAYLEAVAAALPDGVTLDGDTLAFSVTDGSRTIRCRLRLHGLNDIQRASWVTHSLTAETEDSSWN